MEAPPRLMKMYTLQEKNKIKEVKEYFCEDRSSKERNSVNLFESQWKELDKLKEESGVSRSKALRLAISHIDLSEIIEEEVK
jgi:hypothetical protein